MIHPQQIHWLCITLTAHLPHRRIAHTPLSAVYAPARAGMEYLRKEQLAELSRIFLLFARERDGQTVVTSKEFYTLLRALGLPHTLSDAHDLVSTADLKGRGVIDFAEFVQVLSGTLNAVDSGVELTAAFENMDGDHDGIITAGDMAAFVQRCKLDTDVISTPAFAPLAAAELDALARDMSGAARAASGAAPPAPAVRRGSSAPPPEARVSEADFIASMRAQVITH